MNLGDKVKDVATGLEGVVVEVASWLTGCDTALIQSKPKKGETVPPNAVWVDRVRLKVVKRAVVLVPVYPEPYFNLGERVVDSVTGLGGVVTGISCYLSGAVKVGIQAKPKKGEVEPPGAFWVSEARVVRTTKKPLALPKAKEDPGGPQSPPSSSTPNQHPL